MATATYDSIATTTLSTSTASITFSSISGSYTDLILVCQGTLASGNLYFQLNSDTGNNYSARLLKGDGSSATGNYSYSNSNSGRLGEGGSSQGLYITHFNNYSNANVYKTCISRSNVADNHTSLWCSLWRSTSAITTIKIGPTAAGNLDSGFVATLYGIKAE